MLLWIGENFGSEGWVQIPPGAPTDPDVALPSLIFFRVFPQSHRDLVYLLAAADTKLTSAVCAVTHRWLYNLEIRRIKYVINTY